MSNPNQAGYGDAESSRGKEPDLRNATRYTITPEMREELDRRFKYHSPKGDQGERYVALRNMARQGATAIVNMTPMSREQSLALKYLEQSVMWANAAIARNE